MIFDNVHIISKHIQPIAMAEVERLESTLGIKLPIGYRNFITRFGVGYYCDLFYIYAPDYILQEYAQHREFWKEWYYTDTQGKSHWFFEGSESILNEAQLQECVIIGDTKDGDELVFYPAQPDNIYILPRHSDKIDSMKADLSDLHAWGRPTPYPLTFAPWHNQTNLNFRSLQFSLTQATCLEQFKARWGGDSILMIGQKSDAWSWQLIFFLPPVGGRIQIIQDEGVTRTKSDEKGNTWTVGGGGQRYLHIQIACDEEAEADVRAFFTHLETQGLATFLSK
jgi:hypothetical protein